MVARIRARLAAEDGVTLIELLTTMIMAIIVSLALFAFQDVTLNQTSRTFAKVDANQRARNVIETIESKLHSSCIAEGVTPIIAGSTATSLSFISKYGSANKLTPEKHTITLNGTTSAPGTLVETVYPFASGTNAAPGCSRRRRRARRR